jgi:hypothetical protein
METRAIRIEVLAIIDPRLRRLTAVMDTPETLTIMDLS